MRMRTAGSEPHKGLFSVTVLQTGNFHVSDSEDESVIRQILHIFFWLVEISVGYELCQAPAIYISHPQSLFENALHYLCMTLHNSLLPLSG